MVIPGDAPLPEPTRRLVLLGASNVSKGFPTLIETARRAWNGPLDVLAAEGRGRSYGQESILVVRRLPGILKCGLWKAWDQRPTLPTSALLTDIGNDLAYGVPVEQLLAWVEECLGRLRERTDDIVVTMVPLARLRRVKSWQFVLLRTLLFPRNRENWASMWPRVEALDAGLRRLVESRDVTVVEADPTWYGIDPIHVRPSPRCPVWSAIVAAWREAAAVDPVRTTTRDWLRSQLWRPERRRLFGLSQRCAQPCVVLEDGTRVSLY